MYSARQAEHCRSWEESRYSCQTQWNFPCVWEVTMFPWKRSSVIWTTVVWSISLLNCSWPRPLTMSSWKWFSWRSLYWMEGMLTYKWVFERMGGEGSVGKRWRNGRKGSIMFSWRLLCWMEGNGCTIELFQGKGGKKKMKVIWEDWQLGEWEGEDGREKG